MRQITQYPAMKLAVYQLVQGTLWKQPGAIFDEHNELVGLDTKAADDIARMVGLTGGSAYALYDIQPNKFILFEDLFQPGQADTFLRSYFIGNMDGTHLYKKIPESHIETLAQVEQTFQELVDRDVTIKGGSYKEEPAIFAVEVSNLNGTADLTVITIFDILNDNLMVYAMRQIEDTLSVHKIYDKAIAGPKHTFQSLDVDYGVYCYDVLENPRWTDIIAGGFRLSLREIIECLQAVTECKPLVTSGEEALLSYELAFGEASDKVKAQISKFYKNIDLFTFFYDDKQTIVRNAGFLSEPKSTAKPHLYFALETPALDVIRFITTYLNATLNVIDLTDQYTPVTDSTVITGSEMDSLDLNRLIAKLRFFDKFGSRRSFDALEVPNYFDLIALGLAEIHDIN